MRRYSASPPVAAWIARLPMLLSFEKTPAAACSPPPTRVSVRIQSEDKTIQVVRVTNEEEG